VRPSVFVIDDIADLDGLLAEREIDHRTGWIVLFRRGDCNAISKTTYVINPVSRRA
jgi:hypothetical protein